MNNMEIIQINKDEAVYFIQKYHYSKTLPKLTKYYLGVYKNDCLIGVITLGWGTQPLQTIKSIFYKHELKTKDYLEIGRMAFLPEINNSNYGSMIMSKVVKWLIDKKEVLFLYTMADGIMGKCGYVYQASNFKYIGEFKTSVYFDTQTKEKIHPKGARLLREENAKYENKDKVFWLTNDFCKIKNIDKITGLMFRYVYPISNEAKKIFKQYPEYQNCKNPKGENLIFWKRENAGQYVKIEQPQFDMSITNHNTQKYNKDIGEQLDLFGRVA